jgi:crotonobetainyl-CoA:carnitine CoA-transferase CaiB-like acyl-CoA transferase
VKRDTPDGAIRFPGIPTDFSATPGEIGDTGPRLGADSFSILEGAGFGAQEITALRKSGAVRG